MKRDYHQRGKAMTPVMRVYTFNDPIRLITCLSTLITYTLSIHIHHYPYYLLSTIGTSLSEVVMLPPLIGLTRYQLYYINTMGERSSAVVVAHHGTSSYLVASLAYLYMIAPLISLIILTFQD